MKVFRKYPDFQKYEIDYAPAISLPDLEILPDQRKVYCGKQEVSLTTKEFNLLCYFAANEGRVLIYEQIYQKIWGNYVQDIENNTIGSHVCKLREKLYKACPDRKFEIRCVREIGYCFEAKYRRLLKLYGFYVPSVAVKPGLKSGKIRFLKISHYTV